MARSDDEERKIAKLREDVRRLRDSVDYEEDSQVTVHLHPPVPPPPASRKTSIPATAKPLMVILNVIPPQHRVLIVLAVIASAVYTGKALGWF